MKPFRSGVLGMVGALATGALVIGALAPGLRESVPQKLATPTLRATLPVPNLTPLPSSEAPETPYASTPRPVTVATSPTNPAACPPPSGWITYTVSTGDDVRTLAETHGSSLEQIMVENCLISDMVLSDTITYLPPFAPTAATPGETFPIVGYSPASTEKACVQPTGWIKYTVKLGGQPDPYLCKIPYFSFKFTIGKLPGREYPPHGLAIMGTKRPNPDLYLLANCHATTSGHTGTTIYAHRAATLTRNLDRNGFHPTNSARNAFRLSNPVRRLPLPRPSLRHTLPIESTIT